MKDYFSALSQHLNTIVKDDEFFAANAYFEESAFIRFNHGKIRQPGSVKQADLSLDFIWDERCVKSSVRLSFNLERDQATLNTLIDTLRSDVKIAPKDAHLLYNSTPESTEYHQAEQNFSTEHILQQVIEQSRGLDLVGIYAGGEMSFGFANSVGQFNWHSAFNFNLDWSIYLGGDTKDKAVKCNYAGYDWDDAIFSQKIAQAKEGLTVLQQPAKDISPGTYRAYLSPSALNEIISLLNWGGFSQQTYETKQSPLQQLHGGKYLNPKVTLRENTAAGVGPCFQTAGYIKPDCINLIEGGAPGKLLCSPRTGKEYQREHNGAGNSESAEALELLPGTLADADILSTLDTGLYISNLWYLNYSDRTSGRITGMTRFATFWVENGKIQAPVNVVRFDDSIFNMLGDNLIDLSYQRELMLDTGTYEHRSSSSANLPGALLSEFKVTL